MERISDLSIGDMNIQESIKMTKEAFEKKFAESNYYNLQTQVDKQASLLLKILLSII
jgi:hypothetical protein